MSRIETEHNGHKITYADNKDVWVCWELDLEAHTLSLLKTKINKVDADARRANVPVIVLSHFGSEVDAMGVVTLIDGPKEAWVVTKDRRGNTERRKRDITRLVLDTPENRAAIKAAAAKRGEAQSIIQHAEEMMARIPRLTAADLKSTATAN